MEDKQTKPIKNAILGVIALIGVVLLVAFLIDANGPAKAEIDSDARNPGLDKRVSELGTAMKGWAIAFGVSIENNASESKTAFLNDVDKVKNSKFVQDTIEYQKKGWAQGQQDLAKTGEDIKNLPSNIATGIQEAPAKIENFINSTSSGIGNWFMNEWDSIVEYQKKSWQAE
jgi:hypothetical protein